MEQELELKRQVLKSIKNAQQFVNGRVLAPEPVIGILHDLARAVSRGKLGSLNIRLIDQCYYGMVETKASMDSYVKRNIIHSADDSELVYIINFLRGELDKLFTPIELESVNSLNEKLIAAKVNPKTTKAILNTLRKVHQAPYQHVRVEHLLALKQLCNHWPQIECLQNLMSDTHAMLKIIFNVQNDTELKDKLVIRKILMKYKSDFVTMPPAISPQGILLRALLEFELADNSNKPELLRCLVQNSLHSWKKDVVVFDKTQYRFKHPRKVYLALLVPLFLQSIAKGTVRPLCEADSIQALSHNRFEFSENELETMRLYPCSDSSMFLKLEQQGKGDEQSLRFYPFSTHRMLINNRVPHRGMLVLTPAGDYYSASYSALRAHSSLANTALFAGYIESRYGMLSEVGTLSASFKTTEFNAVNFFKILHQDLRLIDQRLLPNYFIDDRHSQHLLSLAIKAHKPKVYELITNIPYKKESCLLSDDFYRYAAFQMNRVALNVLNYEQNIDDGFVLPRTKIPLEKIKTDFPKIAAALSKLDTLKSSQNPYKKLKANIELALLGVLRKRYKINLNEKLRVSLVRNKRLPQHFYKLVKTSPLHASSDRERHVYYYPRELEKIVEHTYQRYAADAFIPDKMHNGEIAPEDLTDFFLNHTIFYNEKMQHYEIINQTDPYKKMHEFISAPTNIKRSRSRRQKIATSILENNNLGTLISSIVLGAYTTIAFVFVLNIYSLTLVASFIAISTLLSLCINYRISERDICWGYFTNIAACTLLFIATLLVIPVSPSIAIPTVFTTWALPLISVPFAAVHMCAKALLDHHTSKRCVDTQQYSYDTTHKVEIKQRTNAYKETMSLIEKEHAKRKNYREKAAFKHDRKQSVAPGSATRYGKQDPSVNPKHFGSPLHGRADNRRASASPAGHNGSTAKRNLFL